MSIDYNFRHTVYVTQPSEQCPNTTAFVTQPTSHPTRQCPYTTSFEKEAQPTRTRTDIRLLKWLYRYLGRTRAQELCGSRGGRPGLLVPNSPYGLCGRKATLNYPLVRAQELCESRGGRPGLLVPNSPYSFYGRKATLKQKLERQSSVAV